MRYATLRLDNICTKIALLIAQKRYLKMRGVTKLLFKAFKNKFEMNDEDAKKLARIISNIFRNGDEVDDASIDKYVRSLLYDLQNERFVKVRREEIKKKNRLFRKYYWYLNMEAIKKEANKSIDDDPGRIYRMLARRVWLSRNNRFNI